MQEKAGKRVQEVTIYDIAKMAGVSPSTVSRVVNDKPNVKKATRAKVLKLLQEYGYTVNETARGLVTQSSRMIGVLISDIRTTHHTDGIFYLQRELSQKGYSCLIYNTGTEAEEQVRYIQTIGQRKVDAAVLMGSIYQTEAVRDAIQKYIPSIPVFLCNGYLDLPNVYGLIADERRGVCDCVELLANKGRRNLAFILNRYTPSNCLKEEGFIEGVRRCCGGAPATVIESGTATDGILEATKGLLREHPEINGITCSEDLLAVIGLRALTEMNRKVPEDVAVIGINNSQYAQICTPMLTSLDNMLYDLSSMVARDIFQVLNGQHVNRKVMVCSKIVERQST